MLDKITFFCQNDVQVLSSVKLLLGVIFSCFQSCLAAHQCYPVARLFEFVFFSGCQVWANAHIRAFAQP